MSPTTFLTILRTVLLTAALAATAPALAQSDPIADILAAALNRDDGKISAISQQLTQQASKPALDAASAKELNKKATELATAGDHESALQIWGMAQSRDPGNPVYGLNSAQSYLKTQRPKEAIMALHAAIQRAPRDMRPWYQLGRAYAAAGMQEQAIGSFYMAVHVADDPSKVREYLKVEPSRTEVTVALRNAVLAAYTLSANQVDQDPMSAMKRAAASVKPAQDIAGIASLALNDTERFDLSNSREGRDKLYERALGSYMMGYLGKREETYYNNAVVALRRAAYMGHAEAAGLLGIILAAGYTNNAGKVAPDATEARKLFLLSDSRGGTMGAVGYGDVAFGGKGEPADRTKAIGLYEKAAGARNELAVRRLIDLTLDASNQALAGQARDALKRAGVAPHFIASVVHARSSRNPHFDQWICAELTDSHERAVRQGNREDQRAIRDIGGQLKCWK